MENEFRTCASSNTLMEGSDWISLFEHNSEHIKLNYEEKFVHNSKEVELINGIYINIALIKN